MAMAVLWCCMVGASVFFGIAGQDLDAVSAAALVIGMRLGPDKMKAYPVIQDFCAKFKGKCGSIICRDLLEGTGATTGGAPEPRTPEYYQKRPCVELVKIAAALLQEV